MKIIAPADSREEAAALIESGAGALYCGYVPESWLREHAALETFNRRTFAEAQITTEDELGSVADIAGSYGVPLWITFNASYYPRWMYDAVLDDISRLIYLGAAGFIVSDPVLITMLIEEGIGPLSLSTMAGVFNSASAAFYGSLGVKRITLPRALGVNDISEIARANPGIMFDIFALFGACANIECFCRWAHDDPGRVWPCVKKYHVEIEPGSSEDTKRAVGAQTAWGGLSRIWACGLCSLWDLSASPNVEGLKIVGRGAPTSRKIAGVRMLRGLLELLDKGLGKEEFLAESRSVKLRYSKEGCRPQLCYFPEFL